MVQSTTFDGLMPMWHHADCILKKANQIKSIDDVESLELLRWEDQQKIGKYIESGSTQKSNVVKDTECGNEVSQTSLATCRHCGIKIIKGEECTGAADSFLNGVNAPTLPANQNTLKGGGKSQRKPIIST